jgi:arsenite methyltransferase
MLDCASCRLFELESQGENCIHVNRPGGLKLTEQAIELCHLPDDACILDAACGTGASLEFLTHQKKYKAVGVDLSSKMLHHGLEGYPDLSLLQADGGKIPLPDASQDAILMECALSLSKDAGASLQEFHRVLRQDGRLILTDIYVRELVTHSDMDCLSVSHCLSGAMTEVLIRSTLSHQGFQVTTWQDKTEELKQWLAGMVFRLGSLGAVYRQLVSDQNDTKYLCATLGKKLKLGYYLLTAEKQVVPV